MFGKFFSLIFITQMGKFKKSERRDKIMAAAKKLFIQKGLDGLKMRELANAAGVNKGLLHYYFRSKQTLFQEVFTDEAAQLYTHINEILLDDLPFEEKLSQIVDEYFELLVKNPGMPVFVMSEMAKNPGFLPTALQKEIKTTLSLLSVELEKKGKQEQEATLNFLLTLLSLCIFPFVAKPILQQAGSLKSEDAVRFIVNRKEYVKSILLKSLEL